MAKKRKTLSETNYLSLVWVRGETISLATKKSRETRLSKKRSSMQPTVTKVRRATKAPAVKSNADFRRVFESDSDAHRESASLLAPLTESELRDFASWELTPDALAQVKRWLPKIQDAEELSSVLIDTGWFFSPELQDEFRRAISGTGEMSRLLYRVSGFEFIFGAAPSCAYRGNGPLSTPLGFNGPLQALDDEDPNWNQDVIYLTKLRCEDAIELSCCLSFMMH